MDNAVNGTVRQLFKPPLAPTSNFPSKSDLRSVQLVYTIVLFTLSLLAAAGTPFSFHSRYAYLLLTSTDHHGSTNQD